MGNIRNLSAISASDAVLAVPVSNNFSQIVYAINSSALNSDNYGQSSIKAANVSTNAFLSQHLSAGGFPAAKFSSSVLLNSHFNFRESDGGVAFVEIGAVASMRPVNGIISAHYSRTISNISDSNRVWWTQAWSDAIHGNPGFATTPMAFGQPALEVNSASGSAPTGVNVRSMGSVSAVFMVRLSTTGAQTMTVHFDMFGAASA